MSAVPGLYGGPNLIPLIEVGEDGMIANIANTSLTNSVSLLTFSTLPSSPTEGMLVGISDSNVSTFGTTITAGGGTNHGLAYYNGTNWTFR